MVKFPRMYLKITIPVRGRKLHPQLLSLHLMHCPIKNHNPRKGTETVLSKENEKQIECTLKITIPVRGRKQV